MKVLALLSRIPWPLEKGDKLRAYHHVKSIAEEHEVILVCLSDKKEHPQAREELLKFCDEVHFIRLNKLGILWNLGLSIFNTKPFSVNYFFQSSAQKKVHTLIEKHMPRHMFIQLVRTAEYAKKYQLIPSTFDYMDAFSMGAQRRVNKAIPGLKHLLSIEASRLKNYENETFNFFTHKTIISETDRDLIQHPEKSKIEILPNGVDFQTFTKDDSVEKKYQLVFTGNMSYPPNVKAAKYLAEKIMPLVCQHAPNAKLAIAGASPGAAVKALATNNIIITGWLPEITTAYNESEIFIAPMQIGTGMQNKILEAMAMQIPVITSPLAAEAIGAVHNETLLIANTDNEYLNHIQSILNSSELRNKLVTNGYAFVRKHYDWETNSKKLLTLISSS